jgi:4-carboxymuconolactone decarboxylase
MNTQKKGRPVRLHLYCVLIFALAASAQDKPKLDLNGDRFPGLTYEQLTPAQRLIADRALAGRGTIGIFNIQLRSPELSEAMRGIFGGRTEPLLSARQNELAILITGRFWTTQYEWAVHHRVAAQAGVPEDTINAIREGRRPTMLQPDEAAMYNFLTALLNTKQVSDSNFQALKEQLGEKRIVDLIALVGFYQTVSLMMNVDRFPLTGNQKPELEAMAKPLPLAPAAGTFTISNRARFTPVRSEEMTDRQKALVDLVESGKIEGGTVGPFSVLLHSPELGEAILRYGAYERFHMPLPARLKELAALITLRTWSSPSLWSEHRRAASEAGLSESVIRNIAEGKRPSGLGSDEEAVYSFCAELLRTTQMTDATFNVAKKHLGEGGVVEIMGEIGYYQTAAMLLNADHYFLADRTDPEFKPLANPIP